MMRYPIEPAEKFRPMSMPPFMGTASAMSWIPMTLFYIASQELDGIARSANVYAVTWALADLVTPTCRDCGLRGTGQAARGESRTIVLIAAPLKS